MTIPGDTLACDTLRLAAWRANPNFDYNREHVETGYTLWQVFVRWLSDHLRSLLGYEVEADVLSWVLLMAGIALLGFVGWIVWTKTPGLFKRVGKTGTPAEGEDTIYGIDFPEEIVRAVRQSDYRQAVRFTYLYTLKQLSDTGRINWQQSKTPTEYIYELKDEEAIVHFRELTRLFMRVRYGNYAATQALFGRVNALHEALQKGGESV